MKEKTRQLYKDGTCSIINEEEKKKIEPEEKLKKSIQEKFDVSDTFHILNE